MTPKSKDLGLHLTPKYKEDTEIFSFLENNRWIRKMAKKWFRGLCPGFAGFSPKLILITNQIQQLFCGHFTSQICALK